MSAINDFRIIGKVIQNASIRKTKTDNKMAFCVVKPVNSDTLLIPIIAFGDTAKTLNYLGRKGNMLQINGNITSNAIIKTNKKALEITLVANEILLINMHKQVKLSDRDFTDLFKLYDLPKYNPIKKEKR